MSKPDTAFPSSLENSIVLADRICRRVPFMAFQSSTDPDVFVYAGCKAWQCLVCGPKKARQITGAVAWAAAQQEWCRLITLTLAPEDWLKRRKKVQDVGRWAAARDWDWNIAWTTEHNPKGTGLHIHAVHWGDFINQDQLQERWGAHVDMRGIRNDPDAVSGYIGNQTAATAGYIGKAEKEPHGPWVALNGGRGLHWTRGFFHGLTLPDAIKASKVAREGQEGTVWLKVEDEDLLWDLYHKTLPQTPVQH